MPHQHRMRAFAAYGQGGALQMAHAHLQNQVAGAVINREVHANFRNFQIPHHILKGEQAIIACGGLLPIGLRRRLGQLAVIGPCFLFLLFQLRGVFRYLAAVVGNGFAVAPILYLAADDGVED